MITKLTLEQEAFIPFFVKKWVDVGLSTQQVSNSKIEEVIFNVRTKLLKYKKGRIIICRSPVNMWNQVENQVQNQAENQAENQVENNYFVSPYLQGHWNAPYFVWGEFMKSIGVKGFSPLWDIYLQTINVGWIYPLKDITFVCEKPKVINLLKGFLHNDGGPALTYSDGWGIWALNGVIVTKEIAETRGELLDANLAIKEKNVEVRREIIRKIGVERYIQKIGAKSLDNMGNYELLSVKLSNEISNARYLKMKNPSVGVWHVEAVAPECNTVQEALNWRVFADKSREWKPEILT